MPIPGSSGQLRTAEADRVPPSEPTGSQVLMMQQPATAVRVRASITSRAKVKSIRIDALTHTHARTVTAGRRTWRPRAGAVGAAAVIGAAVGAAARSKQLSAASSNERTHSSW